jgi:hypothetical protein
MPTMHGETVVIRLLRKETEKAKTLAEVGLDERDRVVVERGPGRAAGPDPDHRPHRVGLDVVAVRRAGLGDPADINVVTWRTRSSTRWPA